MNKLNKEQLAFVLDRIATEIKIDASRQIIAHERAINKVNCEEITKIVKLSDFKAGIEDKDVRDIEEFCSQHNLDGIRFCAKCGKPIIEGYDAYSEIYCSLECLDMTQEQVDDQYSDDADECIYWTEWEI